MSLNDILKKIKEIGSKEIGSIKFNNTYQWIKDNKKQLITLGAIMGLYLNINGKTINPNFKATDLNSQHKTEIVKTKKTKTYMTQVNKYYHVNLPNGSADIKVIPETSNNLIRLKIKTNDYKSIIVDGNTYAIINSEVIIKNISLDKAYKLYFQPYTTTKTPPTKQDTTNTSEKNINQQKSKLEQKITNQDTTENQTQQNTTKHNKIETTTQYTKPNTTKHNKTQQVQNNKYKIKYVPHKIKNGENLTKIVLNYNPDLKNNPNRLNKAIKLIMEKNQLNNSKLDIYYTIIENNKPKLVKGRDGLTDIIQPNKTIYVPVYTNNNVYTNNKIVKQTTKVDETRTRKVIKPIKQINKIIEKIKKYYRITTTQINQYISKLFENKEENKLKAQTNKTETRLYEPYEITPPFTNNIKQRLEKIIEQSNIEQSKSYQKKPKNNNQIKVVRFGNHKYKVIIKGGKNIYPLALKEAIDHINKGKDVKIVSPDYSKKPIDFDNTKPVYTITYLGSKNNYEHIDVDVMKKVYANYNSNASYTKLKKIIKKEHNTGVVKDSTINNYLRSIFNLYNPSENKFKYLENNTNKKHRFSMKLIKASNLEDRFKEFIKNNNYEKTRKLLADIGMNLSRSTYYRIKNKQLN